MLLDLQRAFRATVLSHEDAAASLVQTPHGAVARRLAVYRNTVQKSLVDVLAAAFPIVQRIVGERFFFALARDFATRFPPHVPQLSVYGADFPAFIADHERTGDLPYLADVARVEWARGQAYFAEDAEPLNPQTLSALALEKLPAAIFHLHPATNLVSSRFPIHRIWSVNQPDVAQVPAVDMSVSESVLITRPQYQVIVRALSSADATFVAACARGLSLNDATMAALAVDDAFDLQTALQHHLLNATFVRLTA